MKIGGTAPHGHAKHPYHMTWPEDEKPEKFTSAILENAPASFKLEDSRPSQIEKLPPIGKELTPNGMRNAWFNQGLPDPTSEQMDKLANAADAGRLGHGDYVPI